MKPWWIYAAVAGAFALVAFAFWPRGRDSHGHVESGNTALEPLFDAPAFAFPDQHGQTVTLQSLRGKVWVANFIFTTCRTICPLLTAKMGQLQRRLEGVDARFVSFSVDPEHDTPEALRAYAAQWRPDEQRWSLLATGAQTLPPLVNGFRVVARKSDADAAVDPILHSSVFLLIDAQGQVRGAYDSERPEQFGRLEGDVRTLARSAVAPPALAETGEALYLQLGCAGCHARPELAPSLLGIAGSRRALENGLTAVADEAYVVESIVVPQARRAAGYTLVMPTYSGLLDQGALGKLTAYVLSLTAAQAGSQEVVTVEKDPVCGMEVRATSDAPRLERGGRTYWFCSAACRDRFAAGDAALP